MTAFRTLYSAAPEGTWAAPGRVNLIGEHTDYNDGLVLPVALPHTTRLQARRREDGLLRLHSTRGGEGITTLDLDGLTPGGTKGWAAYPAAAVWALRNAGHVVAGADLLIDSDVPEGAGLSSSAALECAVVTAYNDLYHLGLDGVRLARLAQHAENAYVGVPCGIMDQTASMSCREGHALLLDTRDLTTRQVPLDLRGAGLRLLVIDTRVKHDLADGAYAKLRAGCERAAELLGLPRCATSRPLPCPGPSSDCRRSCDHWSGTWSRRTTGSGTPPPCSTPASRPASVRSSPPGTPPCATTTGSPARRPTSPPPPPRTPAPSVPG